MQSDLLVFEILLGEIDGSKSFRLCRVVDDLNLVLDIALHDLMVLLETFLAESDTG